jgi:glycine cleavage system H protein
MEAPPGLKYSKEHEWVSTGDTVVTVGITDHAQEQLGEIVSVELPAVGDKISKDDPFGVIESVKAVSEIFAPVSGTVLEVNEDLPESPEVVNEDPYGDGWLIRIKVSDPADFEDLLDSEEYEELIARKRRRPRFSARRAALTCRPARPHRCAGHGEFEVARVAAGRENYHEAAARPLSSAKLLTAAAAEKLDLVRAGESLWGVAAAIDLAFETPRGVEPRG